MYWGYSIGGGEDVHLPSWSDHHHLQEGLLAVASRRRRVREHLGPSRLEGPAGSGAGAPISPHAPHGQSACKPIMQRGPQHALCP